jgi:hypothetical protein
VIGQLVSVFKGWIPMGIETRFGDMREDSLLDRDTEGRYKMIWKNGGIFRNSDGRLDVTQTKKWVNYYISYLQNKSDNGELTEMDKSNFRRLVAEIVGLGGIMMSGIMLASLAGDDEDSWFSNIFGAVADQFNRVSKELLFFINPSSVSSTMSNLIPAQSALGDMLDFIPNAAETLERVGTHTQAVTFDSSNFKGKGGN